LRTTQTIETTVTGIETIVTGIEIAVTDITQSIQDVALFHKQEAIGGWFDASDNHRITHQSAKKKREPTTGKWFIESDDFKCWTRSTKRFALAGFTGFPVPEKPFYARQFSRQANSKLSTDRA
jgi:hypothetical protein